MLKVKPNEKGFTLIEAVVAMVIFGIAFTGLYLVFGIAMKGRRNELVLGGIGKQVPGDLFDSELIKGHVGVQRADDPIAKQPGPEALLVLVVTVRVGEVSEVEPEPAPTLAIARRGQQTIDHFFIRLRGVVLFKCIHLFRCRRQASQVERCATNQR